MPSDVPRPDARAKDAAAVSAFASAPASTRFHTRLGIRAATPARSSGADGPERHNVALGAIRAV